MIACRVLSVGRMERRYEVTCEVECGGGEAIYIYIYTVLSPFHDKTLLAAHGRST
jgi:hypothetical protein